MSCIGLHKVIGLVYDYVAWMGSSHYKFGGEELENLLCGQVVNAVLPTL